MGRRGRGVGSEGEEREGERRGRSAERSIESGRTNERHCVCALDCMPACGSAWLRKLRPGRGVLLPNLIPLLLYRRPTRVWLVHPRRHPSPQVHAGPRVARLDGAHVPLAGCAHALSTSTLRPQTRPDAPAPPCAPHISCCEPRRALRSAHRARQLTCDCCCPVCVADSCSAGGARPNRARGRACIARAPTVSRCACYESDRDHGASLARPSGLRRRGVVLRWLSREVASGPPG